MKKAFSILSKTAKAIATLLLLLWLLLQTPWFQTWLAHTAAGRLSSSLGTTVSIKKARIVFLNKVYFEGLFVADQHKDTLISAGSMAVNITDWFFRHDTANLHYIGLKDVQVQLSRKDSVWNYQFLLDYFSSPKKTSSGNGIALHLNVVDLENVLINQQDKWRGRAMVAGVGKLHLLANNIDLKKNIFDLALLDLTAPQYREFRTYGLWTLADSARYYTAREASFKADSLRPDTGKSVFALTAKTVNLKDGIIQIYNRPTEKSRPNEFDASDIIISALSGKINNLAIRNDTVTGLVNISARERSGLHLKKLKTRFTMHDQMMEFADLDLQLNSSRLGNYYAMRYNSIDDMDDFLKKVRITAKLQNSTVHFPDIGYFAPLLFDRVQTADLSGEAEGTVSNFLVKNLDLKTGRSRLTGEYGMKGLDDIDKTIISWQTKNSSIALEDLAVWAPELLDLKNTPVDNIGVLTYAGNFKGTPYNFRTKGNFRSIAGSLDADFTLKMEGAGKGFKGIITNAKLDGGRLLGVKGLGQLDFDGTVSSNGFEATNPLLIEGEIKSGTYLGYTYQYLQAKAEFLKNVLTAELSVSDDNLAGNFVTRLNFNKSQQQYNGRGILIRANLQALGLSKAELGFSGEFDIDFKGKNVDAFLGYARLYNARFTMGSKPFSFDSLVVQSYFDENHAKTLSLHTNEADAHLKGRFNIGDLGNSFQYFLSRYYPSLVPAPRKLVNNQDFNFSLKTKNIEPFMALIDPRIKGLNDADISGRLNTDSSLLAVNADVPFFQYDNLKFSNTNLVGNGSFEKLSILGKIGNVELNDSINFPNVRLGINTNYDSTHLVLSTSTQGPLGDARLDAYVYNKPNGFDLHFNESSIIVNNKKWSLRQNGSLSMTNKTLVSNGITLEQDNQQIRLYTLPAAEGNWNNLHVAIRQLNLGDILPYVVKDPRLEGLSTGLIVIKDPLGKPVVTSNLEVNEFRFNNDSIGLIKINGDYNINAKYIVANVISNNPNYDFSSRININLNDSADEQINATIPLNHTRINILRTYLDAVFNDIDGYASGNLQLVGKLNSPKLLGKVWLTGATLKVDYTKCVYTIDSTELNFGRNFINLGSITIKDEKNRTGTLDGIIYHSFFDSLSFNIKMRTAGMTVLDTKSTDNSLFFGRAVANASFDLNGPLNNLYMRIAGKPTDSSHININTKDTRESAEADFIVFKTYGKAMEASKIGDDVNFKVDIDLTANNLCKIDVILDELTGDVIKATGNGNLKIHTGSTDATEIRGRYNVENGIYDYKFQTLIRKPFLLLPQGGNYIEWSGDAYDATMNINAVYEAKNVSLSSLVGNNNNTLLDASAQSYTGNVNVVANLKGRLSKPDIDFEIEFPAGSSMANNLSVQQMINRIKDDATEKLRQVTYLIVFKSFAPYKEGTSNRNPGTELAVNTITELLSSEMGKILGDVVRKITGDQSLNVDISTNFYSSSQLVGGNVIASSGYDRVKVDLNLNKSYFNNRVLVNIGSDFDVNVRSTAVTGFQFLPDVSVEFILTPNRRLRFILFKRDNLDFSGRRNRAGASISYRKDYEKLFGFSEDALLMRHKKTTP